MKTIYCPFLLFVTIWLFCGTVHVWGQEFVSQEYQLALQYLRILHKLESDEDACRLGQIRQEELLQRYQGNLKVMGAELMKAYWTSMNANGENNTLPFTRVQL